MIKMSEEQLYNSRANRGDGGRLWAVVIIFMVLNVGVLAYVTYNGGAQGGDWDRINTELSTLRFQLSSTQLEIQSLREQLKVKAANYTENLVLTQLYNRTKNSVVLISVRTATGGGTGSGFVYDKMGRIITNYHVIADATKMEVYFINGRVVEATLVGADPYSDMAVIEVNVPQEDLHPLKLGSSSDLLVGEYVVAIGNPFGLANTMTIGIVSALGRQSTAPGRYVIVDVIQTDAAINPGNSGGPLLNLRGEAVGMNTWIMSGTGQFSGVGFAVPSDTIKRQISSLIETGTYQHPWIGITSLQLTPSLAEATGLSRDFRGVLVAQVMQGSPAEAAGLMGGTRTVMVDGVAMQVGGDIIIGADGRTIHTFYDLTYYTETSKRPGDTVRLTIIRSGMHMEVDLILGVRPPP